VHLSAAGNLLAVPLTNDPNKVLERRMAASPHGYILPVRRPKTKHSEVKHITSLKKAYGKLIKDHFPNAPFTIYTFRRKHGTRHAQAGTQLRVLTEPMGHSNIPTTTVYVHAARKQKIESTAKLQAFVEAARKAKPVQEEDAQKWKPEEDEWGNPIDESEQRSPSNPSPGEEIEN